MHAEFVQAVSSQKFDPPRENELTRQTRPLTVVMAFREVVQRIGPVKVNNDEGPLKLVRHEWQI